MPTEEERIRGERILRDLNHEWKQAEEEELRSIRNAMQSQRYGIEIVIVIVLGILTLVFLARLIF